MNAKDDDDKNSERSSLLMADRNLLNRKDRRRKALLPRLSVFVKENQEVVSFLFLVCSSDGEGRPDAVDNVVAAVGGEH